MRAVKSRREVFSTIVIYAVLTFFGLLVLLPFYWMVTSAVKPVDELISMPPKVFPSEIKFDAFRRFMVEVPFVQDMTNSFIVAGGIMFISVIVATMTGYALAKFRARGANIVFLLMLSSAMVPPFIKILPLYVGMVRIGLDDTLIGVIIPYYVSIFGIFFMRQYCISIPEDLLSAARVEGASEPTILIWIVFPVVKQACAALAILKFLLEWNNFLWPLIMLSSADKMTIQVAIAVLLDMEVAWDYGIVLAGATMATIPVVVLFLILQRQIINSIALTGQKG